MSCLRRGSPPTWNVRSRRALKAQHWPNLLFLSSRPGFSQNLQVPQTTRRAHGAALGKQGWGCAAPLTTACHGSRIPGAPENTPSLSMPLLKDGQTGAQMRQRHARSHSASTAPLPRLAHSRLRHPACPLRMPQTRGPGNAHTGVHSHAFGEKQWQQAASEINKAKYSR